MMQFNWVEVGLGTCPGDAGNVHELPGEAVEPDERRHP